MWSHGPPPPSNWCRSRLHRTPEKRNNSPRPSIHHLGQGRIDVRSQDIGNRIGSFFHDTPHLLGGKPGSNSGPKNTRMKLRFLLVIITNYMPGIRDCDFNICSRIPWILTYRNNSSEYIAAMSEAHAANRVPINRSRRTWYNLISSSCFAASWLHKAYTTDGKYTTLQTFPVATVPVECFY